MERKQINMKKIIVGLFFILSFIHEVAAQSFTATVNRNPIPEGETFVLTLDLQDVDTQKTPDLANLPKELTVLSVSNGYHTSIINGKVSKSREWNLVLLPNQRGEVVIPSFELEGYQTQPINIQVTSEDIVATTPKAATSDQPKFKMSSDIDNNSPYVQQQINYRLKIFDAGGLQGEAPYFVSKSDDWIIKSLGEPTVETKVVNGKSLREITFNYALFAQKSGELMIPPVRFNGYYLTKNTRKDPFARFFDEDDFFSGFGLHDVFANKTPVDLTAKAIKVDVRPAPIEGGWWLPAEKVTLSAEFEDPKPQFKVGEAVSRTIYLKAVGVLDNQLPELKFAEVSGLKQYPEKPITEMKVENGKIITLAKIANVYIPSQSGVAVLPEIKVNWFNTLTNQMETAALPEYKIMVAPNAQAPKEELSLSVTSEPVVSETNITPKQVTMAETKENKWMMVFAFCAGILLSIALMMGLSFVKIKSDNHKKIIVSAAKEKDLKKLRDELIAWGSHQFPSRKVANLQDVADIFEMAEFNKELDKIREALYAETATQWNVDEFLNVFNKVEKQAKSKQRTYHEPLPKLYK